MPREATTRVTYSSDLEPELRAFDQDTDILKVIPELIVDYLDDDHLAADLWTIAATAFAVDRNLRRPALNSWRKGQEWHRTISTTFPVRNPAWWAQRTADVEAPLNWLTADTWHIEFTQGGPVPNQASLFSNAELHLEGATALFSGGLDSVCGIIADLEEEGDPLHAISVSTNNRMENQQKRVHDTLRNADSRLRSWSPFRLQVRLSNRESTARSRGFVFLTAGVLSAIARGTNSLRLYENGPGALNLALSRGQVGAQAAKAVHPKTLRYMEHLARAVTGDSEFQIENRAFERTKAEMVRRVPAHFDGALAASVSCDTGFSHHEGGDAPAHCGRCSSCVLRRQALAAAGRNIPTPVRGVPRRKDDHPRLMAWQVARLRHVLRDGFDWVRMVREFPDIVCDPRSFLPERREVLLRVFTEYASEWDLPAVIKEFAEE
ncbi:7-cyano-7-deazaguanine synthase [Nocardiopsis prasina]|uniref:7-cyano-7-deazaguanine synthase n=1 Tax=Nocardiopsis prasina TaxID=2015 RepID=UPI00034A9487|nr:7-cyano-7-deazaguanine synthase [Nocardiopsis prasina]